VQQQQQQRSQQPPMHHDEHVYTHAHQPTHPASVRTIAPPQGQGWNLKLLRQFLDHPAWHHTSRAGKGQIMGRGGEQLEIFCFGSKLLDQVIENYYTSNKGLH
jgi:hypothetical protein